MTTAGATATVFPREVAQHSVRVSRGRSGSALRKEGVVGLSPACMCSERQADLIIGGFRSSQADFLAKRGCIWVHSFGGIGQSCHGS